MTSHCITWHDTTQAITSHQMTWPSHDLTPEQTSRHQNTSLQSTKHHHHGRAEGSFTAKKWFGHRAGRSPCAHSIGKFFLCYIVLFLLETSAPGLSGHYWYKVSTIQDPYGPLWNQTGCWSISPQFLLHLKSPVECTNHFFWHKLSGGSGGNRVPRNVYKDNFAKSRSVDLCSSSRWIPFDISTKR